MVELSPKEQAIYRQSMETPHFYVDHDAGYLRLSGETRVDFLQRQTTNDLALLSPAHALVTVLTSPTARILDVLVLVDEGEAIGILPLSGRLESTARFLRSRIFFMDRVAVADASPEWSQIQLGGVGSRQILEVLGVSTNDQSGNAAALTSTSGIARAIRVAHRFPGEHLILAEQSARPHVLAVIKQFGAVELTSGVHELLRVENGIPGPAAELTEDYTPLEAGLQDAVSQGKGCYTGQEIIARQLTYDKVVQQLVGLRTDTAVSSGDALYAGGRRVGVITSVASSPRHGLIALGYVRRPDFEEGQVLSASADHDGSALTVTRLPLEA